MADGYVTVLWRNNWEDSEPVGVFESHAKALEWIYATYGKTEGFGEICEDDPEVYLNVCDSFYSDFVLYRLPWNSAVTT